MVFKAENGEQLLSRFVGATETDKDKQIKNLSVVAKAVFLMFFLWENFKMGTIGVVGE